MGRKARGLGVTLIVAALALGTAVGQERKVQLAAIVSVLASDEALDIGTAAGVGARIDLNLSKTIMISPEVQALFQGYFGPFLLSATANYKFGKGFAGIGAGFVSAFEMPLMVKLQAGAKLRHWTVAGSFHFGGGGSLAGLTVGYLF